MIFDGAISYGHLMAITLVCGIAWVVIIGGTGLIVLLLARKK